MSIQTHPINALCVYNPISRESRDIRLLLLQPGHFSDPILCDILEASLDDDKVKYETLSYVWGDSSITTKVSVDGKETPVTTNLASALKYIRQENVPLTLWVDALCIDQSNMEEKTHQVRLMGDIYRRCTRVYIWLGCEIDSYLDFRPHDITDENDPFTFFYHMASDRHISELQPLVVERPCEPISSEPNFWQGMRKVAQSPWWSRIWTVQEAVLPPASVLVFGFRHAPWSVLQLASQNWWKHCWNCCGSIITNLPITLRRPIVSLFHKVIDISYTRKTMGSVYFWNLVYLHNLKSASDPRDKVLGLLGLADPLEYEHFSPDYTLEVHEVYETVFRLMIKEYTAKIYPDLDFLIGTWFSLQSLPADHVDPNPASIHHLPSWVANFARKMDTDTRLCQEHRLAQSDMIYNVSSGRHPSITFGDNPCTLRLMGVKVATINTLSPIELEYQKSLTRARIEVSLSSAERINGKFNDAERRSFWRVIMGGLIDVSDNSGRTEWIFTYKKVTDADTLHFDTYYFGQDEDNGIDPHFSGHITFSIKYACSGRSFFMTEDRAMGLCPLGTKIGDEVWILHGGNVPFILRHCEEEHGRYHAFVGDCYMDGIMFGEAMNEDTPEGQEVILR